MPALGCLVVPVELPVYLLYSSSSFIQVCMMVIHLKQNYQFILQSAIKDGISPPGMVTRGYTEPFNFSVPPPPSLVGDQDPQLEMTLRSRLLHTKLVWFLPNIQRPAAMHYLQGQPMGVSILFVSWWLHALCSDISLLWPYILIPHGLEG